MNMRTTGTNNNTPITTYDFLEAPPMKNATPADAGWALQQAIKDGFKDLRYELAKLSPDVRAETKSQFGPNIPATTQSRVWFEVGGQPVTVYKLLIWNNDNGAQRISLTGLASGITEGFHTPSEPTLNTTVPLELNIPVDELYIYSATSFSLNSSAGNNSNRGLYIFGWTIPFPEKIDWR